MLVCSQQWRYTDVVEITPAFKLCGSGKNVLYDDVEHEEPSVSVTLRVFTSDETVKLT